MELTVSKAKRIYDDDGWWVCFQAPDRDVRRILENWKQGIEHIVSVVVKRKKRSRDANAYAWKLMDEIAKVIHSTSVDVYRRAILDVGVFDDYRILKEALKPVIRRWKGEGIGKQCIVDRDSYSETDGMVTVRMYYGSSVYDTAEMARLIDWIVQEAQELGIETMTPDELARIKATWKESKND